MENVVTYVLWLGFLLGLAFGFLANKTNFCTLGAISDVVIMGDWGRMRAWLLAIGVAILGTNYLAFSGQTDLTHTVYTNTTIPWVAHVVGGIAFGIGMTLASGCGNKTLVRIGGGNMKAIVVFIYMAYAAQLTLTCVLAPFRANVLQSSTMALHFSTHQMLPSLLASAFDLDLRGMQLAIATLMGGTLIAFAMLSQSFRDNRDNVLAGLAIGILIVAGWFITGKIGFAEDPESLQNISITTNSRMAESMSFVAPAAYTLTLWSMWTDTSNVLTWGIACVFGVGVGSLLYALIAKAFPWEHFISVQDMSRHIVGGVLMGFSGVTTLGCTVVPGITGFSTLSLGSIITFIAIVSGATMTMKYEYWRLSRNAG